MDCADLQHSCSIALIDYVTNLQIIKLLQRLKSIKIFYTAHPYNQTRESEILSVNRKLKGSIRYYSLELLLLC